MSWVTISNINVALDKLAAQFKVQTGYIQLEEFMHLCETAKPSRIRK